MAKMGPHRRGFGRPPSVPYARICELFITAVELELPPVSSTAVVLQMDRLRLERRLWDVRREGWLPRGASPLPGEDRTAWLEQARALVAVRTAEIAACEAKRALLTELAKTAVRAKRQERYYNERLLRPSRYVLDQIGGPF